MKIRILLATILIIIFGVIQVGSTNSFFLDEATSFNNSMTAGFWTPTPSEKITICHVAGRKDDAANYITLEISPQALNGHFDENGTPKAGHEEDYLGPCNSSEIEVAAESTVLPIIEPTESPISIPELPSPMPTETPTQEPNTTTLI